MNRREFIGGAAATLAAGCVGEKFGGESGRMLFGVCTWAGDWQADAKLLASVGYDFFEASVGLVLDPEKDGEWWKAQRDRIRSCPIPLRSCNGFIPGKFRLTGPKADHAPALAYAETALRRAEEVGVKTLVFGSGGARNVPGDFGGPRAQWPDLQKGRDQYAEFCRAICDRIKDLRSVQVVIEPLCPNESNIVNYVWQGVQICEEVDSPRLAQLADLFHMVAGRESPESIVRAAKLIRHCHIASCPSRKFPGFDPKDADTFRPYFDALRRIGYAGGVSCECAWGEDRVRDLGTALGTMRALAQA